MAVAWHLVLGTFQFIILIIPVYFFNSYNTSLTAKIALLSKTLVQPAVRMAHAKCTHALTAMSSLLTEHPASREELQFQLRQLPLSMSKSLSPMISSLSGNNLLEIDVSFARRVFL